MSNTSATGGYLVPSGSQGLPGGLTLTQFIQTVLVGISGFDGTLVRPNWQVAPPKQPDIGVNWMNFGITLLKADTNAWVGMKPDQTTYLLRQEDIEIQLGFYGPDAMEKISILRDGFQIQQNVEALRLANMGYRDFSHPLRGPDLINERWVDRYLATLSLTRQVQRTYPILSFASAEGTIHTVLDGDPHNSNWLVEAEE